MSAKRIEYNAALSQRIEIAPGLAIFRVVPDGDLFDFEPGQYSVLGLRCKALRIIDSDPDPDNSKCGEDPERLIRRAYSIASSSLEREFIEFYITLVRSGELTPRLFNLTIGDRLYLGPRATGLFTLNQVPSHKHILLVSTGTGLAPYISMVRSQLDCNQGRHFVVLNGARYSWDLGYRDELNFLSRLCRNFSYFPIISRPDRDPTWNGLEGRVQTLLASGVVEEKTGLSLTPENFDVFLCGNPAMIEDVIQMVEARGFVKDERKNPGTIHVEEYW
ncbi:MAG: ferredoxin--NADP reductase [Candidatus Omnitrophica bacterium]|nr:ferredoxin--NADP reductase [Candidatus Omnitrophota bacterium]